MLQRVIDFHLELGFSDKNPQQIIFRLQLTNKGDKTISLCQIEDDNGYQHQVGSKLSPEESITIELTDLPEESLVEIDLSKLPLSLPLIAPERAMADSGTTQKESPGSDEEEQECHFPALPNLTLVYYSTRAVDVYVPRSRGLIRHGGEYVDARRKRRVKGRHPV